MTSVAVSVWQSFFIIAKVSPWMPTLKRWSKHKQTKMSVKCQIWKILLICNVMDILERSNSPSNSDVIHICWNSIVCFCESHCCHRCLPNGLFTLRGSPRISLAVSGGWDPEENSPESSTDQMRGKYIERGLLLIWHAWYCSYCFRLFRHSHLPYHLLATRWVQKHTVYRLLKVLHCHKPHCVHVHTVQYNDIQETAQVAWTIFWNFPHRNLPHNLKKNVYNYTRLLLRLWSTWVCVCVHQLGDMQELCLSMEICLAGHVGWNPCLLDELLEVTLAKFLVQLIQLLGLCLHTHTNKRLLYKIHCLLPYNRFLCQLYAWEPN